MTERPLNDEIAGRCFRKKPVEIEAVQFDGDNGADVLAFIGPSARLESATCHGDGPPYLVMIDTLEGTMCAGRDDWIIRGVQGEHYPCKPDIFAATYEEVDGDAWVKPPRPAPGPNPTAQASDYSPAEPEAGGHRG